MDELLSRRKSQVAGSSVEAVRAERSRYVLDTEKLHGDDTPLPVLAPGTDQPLFSAW